MVLFLVVVGAIGMFLAIGELALIAIQDARVASPAASVAPTRSPRSHEISASELQIGDCFDFADPTADEVDLVTVRPCTDAHGSEVIHVAVMPRGAYPGVDPIADFALEKCTPAFEQYVGTEWLSSILEYTWVYPSLEAWQAGDRSIQCYLYDPNNDTLTSSLKGSKR